MSFSALCSRGASAYVSPSMWAAKFCTHKNIRHNYSPCILILYFYISKWNTEDSAPNKASSSRVQSALNFYLLMQFWFVMFVSKCSTISKDLLSVFIMWFCPAFFPRDITIYIVCPAFTSRLTSLLTTTTASVFLFVVCILSAGPSGSAV
jgi:hypothetical protein